MRRSPLQRRTELGRSGVSRRLARGDADATLTPAAPPRYTTIARVSKKRAAQNRERKPIVDAKRTEQEWCLRCGSPYGPADGHELKSRGQGGSITDPDNIIIICRLCNGWAEHQPIIAAWQGWKNSRKNSTAPCIAAGRCARGSHEPFESCEAAA